MIGDFFKASWDFIKDDLTIILAIITGIVLVIGTAYQRKEDDKRVYSGSFWLAVISALILWYTGCDSQRESNENKTLNASLIRKSTELVTVYRKLSDSQRKIIDANQLIIKLQGRLIDTTDKMLGLQGELKKAQAESNQALKEASKSQQELFNQVTGGNSVPVLAAEMTWNPRLKSHEYSTETEERVVFNLTNLGKYPLANIRINVVTSMHHHNRKQQELPDFYIAAGQSREMKDVIFDDAGFMPAPYPIIFKISVEWGTHNYFLEIWMPMREGLKLINTSPLIHFYSFEGKMYNSTDEFKAAMKNRNKN